VLVVGGRRSGADYWGAPASEEAHGSVTVLHMFLSFSGVSLFVDCIN